MKKLVHLLRVEIKTSLALFIKNGLNIMVPPFIEEGDKIILDTRSLEYVKKVN